MQSENAADAPLRFHRKLHHFAILLASCIFVLIVAGALVTSEDAGLSVPDWPTSFGSMYRIPPMVGGIKFEHTHRMIAESVGLLTILFCVAAFRVDRRKWLRQLSLAAIGIVMIQGLLGGITVLYFLPWYISSAHATLAQTFFSIAVLMTVYTGRNWMEMSPLRIIDNEVPSTRTLTLICIVVVYVQLFLGAAFRHSGIGIAAHLANAVVTAGFVTWTAVRVLSRYGKVGLLRKPATIMLGLLMIQLGFGFAAYLTRVVWGKDAVQPLPSMVSTTVLHVAIGALLLAATFVLEEQVRHTMVGRSATIGEREAISTGQIGASSKGRVSDSMSLASSDLNGVG